MDNKPQTAKYFDSPAGWKGRELFARPEWCHRLNTNEISEIQSAAASMDADPILLPILSRRLHYIQDRLEHGAGACMLQGFPVRDFDDAVLKRLFLAIASKIGTPLSQSASGQRIFSVRNQGYSESDPRARGPNTKKKLSYHTDRCDVIAFLCVQQARSGGENYVVSSVSLYNEISKQRPELLQILMQPFYYQRHNVDTGNERSYTKQPIFSIFQGHFAANLLRVLIDRAYARPDLPEMTSQQKEALDFVEQLADDAQLHVCFRQEPGDILFLNNFVTFHRRGEFEDHEDPQHRRHLLRIWLSVPNSRPLHPDFAGNYLATEAGAIRGGMKPTT